MIADNPTEDHLDAHLRHPLELFDKFTDLAPLGPHRRRMDKSPIAS